MPELGGGQGRHPDSPARKRIVDAAIDVILERGYRNASVEMIVERAGVELAEFDRHFADKEDCALQVFMEQTDEFDNRVHAAYAGQDNWRDGLRAAAYTATRWLRDHPREVRFGVLEILEANEMAWLRREAAFQRFAEMIDAGRYEADDPESVPPSAATMAIGAIAETLTRELQSGREVRPVEAVPELMYVAVRPYVGHEAALEELTIASPPEAEERGSTSRKQIRTQTQARVQRDRRSRYLAQVGGGKSKRRGREGARNLSRLPPGRHGLSREFVRRNQRDRLTAGMIAAVAEQGYHNTTITQIAAAAGVSRRTFYSYHSSKEECFLATFDVIGAHLLGAVQSATSPDAAWPCQVRAKLAAALDFFAANPDLVRFYAIAPPRAGKKIAARGRLALSRSLAVLTEGIPAEVDAPSEAIQNALMGGVLALIIRKVEAGEGERLAELLPDVVELFLAPYVGREEAVRIAGESD